ncbi:hypothetical protein NDU88_000772 [Pleurodeles waltl]|uniref:Uncharacterized protein n=1 Tax=Pleurodeles waltl TaxID=8319 RepID=A0AAV7P3U4_PLEWA|nr:hypothetical protein NDU88_000772 [Pleurodeles waltl]
MLCSPLRGAQPELRVVVATQQGVRVCFRTATNPTWCSRASEMSAVLNPAPAVQPPFFFFRATSLHFLVRGEDPRGAGCSACLDRTVTPITRQLAPERRWGSPCEVGHTARFFFGPSRVSQVSYLSSVVAAARHKSAAPVAIYFFFFCSAPLVWLYVFSMTRKF